MNMTSNVISPTPTYCPLCAKKGKKTKIQPFSVNLEESVYFCSSVKCTYPFGEYLLTTVHSLPDEEQAKINEEILEENRGIEVADIIASMSCVQNNIGDISFTSSTDVVSQDINQKNSLDDSQLNVSDTRIMINTEELYSTMDSQGLLLNNMEEHNESVNFELTEPVNIKNGNETMSLVQNEESIEAGKFTENSEARQMKFSANGEPDFLNKITEEYMNISKSSEPAQTTQLLLPFKTFFVSNRTSEELEQENNTGLLNHKELNDTAASKSDSDEVEFVETKPENNIALVKKNKKLETNFRLLSASRRHIVVKRKNLTHSLKN